jgi:serine/threonine protein kinase
VTLDREGEILEEKYKLVRELGEGGMGVVWLAEHMRLGRPLAVKLLRPDLAGSARTLRRFHQEAVAASRIGNPHIVEVIDIGTAPDGGPFIVMELLEGKTLFEVLREAPVLPVARACDIVCQVLSGLAAAHAKGIVHRDLKPANIFLTKFGTREDFVKLVDFGVSKIMTGEEAMQLTRTGAMLGTPTYMAPEQVLGRKEVDHRVDLWAAGVILYMMLTGKRPHEAPSRNELLVTIVNKDVQPFRQLRAELDERLERIVLRALTRDMAQRWGTAEEFRDALLPYRMGAPAYAAAGGPTPAFSFAAVRDLVGRSSLTSSPPGIASPSAPPTVPPPAGEPTVAAVLPSAPPAAPAAVPVEGPADDGHRVSVVWEIEPIKRSAPPPAQAAATPLEPAPARSPSAPSRVPLWIAGLAMATLLGVVLWILLRA